MNDEGGTIQPPDIDGLTDFRSLGAGGFSRVFAAFDVDFKRWVAVKVLHSLDDDGRRRFERERELMGRLDDHPNVITPFRSGYTPSGQAYLVMEYAARGSLEGHLDNQGPMGWDEAVGYLLPIADALRHAHALGIQHRDIKPANILVTGTGITKLADFGISRIREATATASLTFTLAHTSPETFASGQDVRDERSDLYSLASTLYTLTTGQAPFATTGQDSAPALMHRILTFPVPTVGQGADQDRRDRFLTRGLAKDPDQRPADAATFAAELRTTTGTGPGAATGWRQAVGDQHVGGDSSSPTPLERQATISAVQSREHQRDTEIAAPTDNQPGTGPGPGPWTGGISSSSPVGQPAGFDPGDRSSRWPLLAAVGAVALVILGFGLSRLTGDDTPGAATTVAPADAPDSTNPDPTPTTEPESGPEARGEPLAFDDHAVETGDPTQDDVKGLAFLPDGRIASASDNGTVRVWHPDDPTAPAITFDQHESAVNAVVALPDGRIASGSGDGTVRVWHPDDPTTTSSFTGHVDDATDNSQDNVRALAALPDGRVASAGADGTVRVWHPDDLDDPDATTLVFHHHADSLDPTVDGVDLGQDDVRGLAALPDGRLASASRDGTVQVWHPDRPAEAPVVFLDHGGEGVTDIAGGAHPGVDDVWTVAALPDGRLASGGADGTVRIWHPDDPTVEPRVFTDHGDHVRSVAVLPDGRLASGGNDGTVRIWHPDDPTVEAQVFTDHAGDVRAVTTLPSGRIASGGEDGIVLVWWPTGS